MEAQPTPSLVFTVRRQEPELVAPATPTPRELKPLSDIDSQMNLRFQIPGLMIYRNNPGMEGKDPVKVIREAIAQALVFYYPFAGRLREGPGLKLAVDCTGEGISFIEADADVALDDFGPVLQPPFPCIQELLYVAPESEGILHCPLLIIQVTRFKCGGFVFGFQLNHTMSDAPGIIHFLRSISEMARGAISPSSPPSWNRDFFSSKRPPRVTHTTLPEFNENMTVMPFPDTVERSFLFDPSHVSTLRKLVPRDTCRFSTFDLLTAFVWRCRTKALQYGPKEDVHVMFMVNARGLPMDPPVPAGYYGNACEITLATTTAERLCDDKSLGHAIGLIRKAKAGVTEEYVRSNIDVLAAEGRLPFPVLRQCLIVSDVRHAGFTDVDFGWGRAAYGGPAVCASGAIRGLTGFYGPHKDRVIMVLVSLPRQAMKIFESEISTMLNGDQ